MRMKMGWWVVLFSVLITRGQLNENRIPQCRKESSLITRNPLNQLSLNSKICGGVGGGGGMTVISMR